MPRPLAESQALVKDLRHPLAPRQVVQHAQCQERFGARLVCADALGQRPLQPRATLGAMAAQVPIPPEGGGQAGHSVGIAGVVEPGERGAQVRKLDIEAI